MATVKNTDFLRFSAYSFKELITRKMTENSKFTDQMYEGSNLAILIDLCSYLFQGLTYCINTAASESMFSDTQIYENINRVVKLIGYNPKGFIPSSAMFAADIPTRYDNYVIPRYSAIDTDKTDSRGNKVYYSLKEDYELGEGTNSIILYNGRWKLYPQIFTASGSNYETFVLDGIESSSNDQKYAAHAFIDVYVKRNEEFIYFKGLTDEIFLNNISRYDGGEGTIAVYRNTDEDRYYSIRLNQDKVYEIKFGNDNNGQKLQKGDQLYIFYMESNGFDAELTIGEVTNKTFIEPTGMLGITKDMLYKKICQVGGDFRVSEDKSIFSTIEGEDNPISNSIKVTNTSASTAAKAEETVEDVRSLAPDYYKLGNRLVTKADFEYYVKNKFVDNVIDVKCQNNWDYVSTLYGWLYKIGKTGTRTEAFSELGGKPRRTNKDGQYYINQSKLSKYDYYYADPVDQNNVYLWVKMQNDTDYHKKIMDEDLTALKVLTSEVVFVDPIPFVFAICAAPVGYALTQLEDDVIFDGLNESYIEVTVSDNALYTNTSIKAQINTIFMEFFNELNMKLGQIVNINDLEQKIYAINGVQRVRTVYTCKKIDAFGNKVYTDRFVDGLSFATWSSSVVDIGDDLTISTTNRTLEDFQFPKLYHTSVMDKVIVIKKSFSNNSTVQY